MKYRVFISHGSGDKYLANHVREKLGEHGIHSFLDQVDVISVLTFEQGSFKNLRIAMNYFVFLLPRRLPEHGSQLRLAQRPFSRKRLLRSIAGYVMKNCRKEASIHF